jgi:phosphoribosylaminoimidazolecarboxamide formyltransferase/IMP cyclohydrolase
MIQTQFPPAPDRVPVRRALLSVFDKAGLVETARALHDLGVELVSTGGTRAAIAAAGLPVLDVSDVTGFPEMMDGRVKTLHPAVHGGLLGVRNAPAHAEAMAEHGIVGVDLLYCTLYPFEQTVAGGAGFDTAVENIDIGGPAMTRSAAKNHGHVAVCTDAEGMAEVLAALQAEGATTLALRRRLAARAFARTAAYDAAVAAWFAGQVGDAAPERKVLGGRRVQSLRYGENPHQSAASTPPARPGRGSPPLGRCRGRRSATTTSQTRTPRSSWWPSSRRPMRRRWPSSSTRTPAAWRWGAAWSRRTRGRWRAIRCRLSAGSWR